MARFDMVGLAGRLLQQDEEPPVFGPDAEEAEEPTAYTLDLRITAIFVILASGLLGGLLPLIIKCFRNSTHPATLILRALAAGVMLALAVIHVVPDGMNDLAELAEYPYGPLAVVFGVLVMVCTESLSRAFMHKHHLDDNTADAAAKPAAPLPAIADEATSSHARNSDFHSHTCVAVNNAAGWATSPQAASVRLQIIAYMFEIACVVHSFLIGLALGVTVSSRQQATALMVALIFHQGLEGIGLGSTIVKASFSWWKGVIMITTYALMTPLGVAIGIAITDSYDPETETALAVQGTLNSVSGGLLLYISLVQLIAEDFTRADLAQVRTGWQVAMHAALAVGAGCMAVIAIWN